MKKILNLLQTFGIVLSPRNGDGEEMSDVDDEAEIEMGSDDMPQAQPHHSQAQEEESDDEIMVCYLLNNHTYR